MFYGGDFFFGGGRGGGEGGDAFFCEYLFFVLFWVFGFFGILLGEREGGRI